jgi:hypothetical protein
MKWAGYVTHLGNNRIVYITLAGCPEGKRTFVRPRCGFEGNIKMGT